MTLTSDTLDDQATEFERSRALTKLTLDFAYGDPTTREHAARELAVWGPAAIDILLTHGLRDADRKVRVAATLSLISVVPGHHIKDEGAPPVDAEAALLGAVVRVHSRGEDGTAELSAALNHRDHKRREAAIGALGILIAGIPEERAR